MEGAVASAARQGAVVVVDGRGLTVPGHEDGFFTGPSLLDRVTPGMDAYREEIFGPVLAVVRVATLDAAIELVNANPYGNGTALFTGDDGAARRFQRGVQVGMIGVNVPVPMVSYSFGGWKDSLIGDSPIHGPEGVADQRPHLAGRIVAGPDPHCPRPAPQRRDQRVRRVPDRDGHRDRHAPLPGRAVGGGDQLVGGELRVRIGQYHGARR